jgi:coenzyme F420-0:L-glutamate ligase/coenzyme F420-1:gamma-L-glutamate ligase
MRTSTLLALEGLPHVAAGDDIAELILVAAQRNSLNWHDGDIVVVAQKIVSKSEGRLVRLEDVVASERAAQLADRTQKDARLVELVLRESHEVMRERANVLIVEHRLGHVMANAGIDRSNVDAAPDDEDVALLLPEDPDGSAAQLRSKLQESTGVRLGVIVSDSFGRAWRLGTVGIAIGVAGPAALLDRRGTPDLFGRRLQITEIGYADAVAAAAVLMMGEGDEGCPVVIARGLQWTETDQTCRDVLRPREQDLFR